MSAVKVSTWRDISSFSQGATDHTPITWQFCASDLRIVVTRHIHHAPDAWLLRCEPFFDSRLLKAKDIDAAKAEALALITARLRLAITELGTTP